MNNKVEHTNDDKYLLALSKYNTDIKDEEVKKEVAKLIKEKTAENNTKDVKAFLLNCIDLTSLTPTDNDESILSMVEKVNQFSDTYPELKNVAAMCVYPNFTSIVKNSLEVEDVNIACVSAGFPSSQTFIEVKIAETAMAIMEGADEVDVVISVGKFLNGDYETLCDELEEIKDLAENKGRHVKVILETGALQSAENIKKASILAMYSGADFIKTSTGKEKISATPEAAYVMCQAIKEYYEETGNKVGFKPAGGLSTPEDAIIYYTIVKEILGTEWLTNKLFRLGTSRLANLLLSDIKEKEINFF
ncbi:MAG: deoxyribose-phosphate aldolase [Bacteroides sp.]|nr:deoxyribose-phosphate aldolase [Bacteroides sp.]MDD4054726.1 deoxyribose-phosphate aldolase [Bacteroides sp.]